MLVVVKIRGSFFYIYHVSQFSMLSFSPMYFPNLKNFHYSFLHPYNITIYTSTYIYSINEHKISTQERVNILHIGGISDIFGIGVVESRLARLQKLMLLSADMTFMLPTSLFSLSQFSKLFFFYQW